MPDAGKAPLASIPRAPYALAMVCASAAALALAYFVSSGFGAEGPALTAILSAVLIGALLGFIALLPSPIVSAENWGLVVLGTSGMRTVLALGAMLLMIEVQGLPRKPVVYGLLAGVFVLMVVEASAAALLLSQRERRRSASLRQSNPNPSTTHTPAGSVA